MPLLRPSAATANQGTLRQELLAHLLSFGDAGDRISQAALPGFFCRPCKFEGLGTPYVVSASAQNSLHSQGGLKDTTPAAADRLESEGWMGLASWIPIALLARLGVDERHEGQGLGAALLLLLKDIRRTLGALPR